MAAQDLMQLNKQALVDRLQLAKAEKGRALQTAKRHEVQAAQHRSRAEAQQQTILNLIDALEKQRNEAPAANKSPRPYHLVDWSRLIPSTITPLCRTAIIITAILAACALIIDLI